MQSPGPRPSPFRRASGAPSGRPGLRALAAVSALVLAAGLAGCTPGTATPQGTANAAASQDPAAPAVSVQTPGPGYARIDGEPAVAALAASGHFFASSRAAVVLSRGPQRTTPTDFDAAVAKAVELGVPLLLASDDESVQRAVRAELQRLGVQDVVRFGETPAGWSAMVEGTTVHEGADAAVEALGGGPREAGFAVVHAGGAGALGSVGLQAVLASARAAGAQVRQLASDDPRENAEDRDFLRRFSDTTVFAVGRGLGPEDRFASLAATAAAGTELPGGGQTLFPHRRMVALYGHPGTASLGLLGEQGIEASITRAKELAADYQPYSREPVQPAFEIITTVASAAPGADGKYSSYADPEMLEPWVDAAEKAGVYVVLDLQPGRNDFLTQAKKYRKLLERPHVGLALDPEWRLGPGQRHMVQIGSVTAAEIDKVSAWLAGVVREEKLPQKLLILHQFQLRMIEDREDLETGHPELALVVHADGHGTPGQKMETWNTLRRDLPEGVRMAWKNFIDEDSPTFTPERTFREVSPKPWFVSYQ